ncbi:MAG: transporter substrate-binding domain-containing protein [Phycisphaera sp.]|nr:transporter substrate-binding domain-containing protein [Phycisphaera sp.]
MCFNLRSRSVARRLLSIAVCATVIALFASIGAAQTPDAPAAPAKPRPRLRVVTKVTPPFAMRDADGNWSGISIELWRRLADEVGVDYDIKEMTLDQMLDAVATGKADVAISAISVTMEREERLDFTHSYFTTGLGVAVPRAGQAGFWRTLQRVFSARFFAVAALLVVVTIACGVVFWLLERRAKTGPFAERKSGIRDGIWWAVVILLGNKGVNPNTSAARALAATGMFASLLALSTLTGAIASVLTVGQLDTPIQHPDDLRRVSVVTLADSTSAKYLRDKHIRHRTVGSIDEAFAALADGSAEAVVYDAPILKYTVNQSHSDRVVVLPWTFQQQEYAVALATDSPWREPMNRVLLELRNDDAWRDIRFRYLGE